MSVWCSKLIFRDFWGHLIIKYQVQERNIMKPKIAVYWGSTGLLALALLGAGFANVTHAPEMVKSMEHLGYPVYFMTILGIWKILGGIAVLAPGFPTLKEWAYAGIFFTFTGALFSHLASGDTLVESAPPVVLLLVALASWSLRPEGRRG